MNEQAVNEMIAGLIAKTEATIAQRDKLAETLAGALQRIESLTRDNESLRIAHHDCSQTVGQLTEDLAAARAKELSYRKRPPVMQGRTVQTNVGCGPLYITLNEDEQGRPFEVFFKLGKSGSCQQSYLEALGVVMSVAMRYGADPQKFIDKLAGMRCPNPKLRNALGPQTLSCADGISQGLAKALSIAVALPGLDHHTGQESVIATAVAEPNMTLDLIAMTMASPPTEALAYGEVMSGEELARSIRQGGVGMCPKCSGPLIAQGGCVNCAQSCGYVGKCG